jgi:hypothetical protein
MNRFRLVALAIVLATAMVPGQVAVAQLAPPAPSLHASLPTLSETWSLIRQWFGGTQLNCGPTIDPTGGCAGNAPQPSPPRVQCGPTGDPTGGCAGSAPQPSPPRVQCGPMGDPTGGCAGAALPQRPAAGRGVRPSRHGQ